MAHEIEILRFATSELYCPLENSPYEHVAAMLSGAIGAHAETREKYVATGLKYLENMHDRVEKAIAIVTDDSDLKFICDPEADLKFEDEKIRVLGNIYYRVSVVDPIAFQKALEADWDERQAGEQELRDA